MSSDPSRIVVLKGRSLYGGLRLFCDQAADAFRRAGHEVEVLDIAPLERPDLRLVEHAASAGPFDLVFTINIAGEFRDPAGRTLGELYGGRHVVWHTDYILGQYDRLRKTPQSTSVLVVDPTQADAVRSIYGEDRFQSVSFFPHPAVGHPAEDDADVDAFLERRPIGILWSGSFQKPQCPWANLQPASRSVFEEALDLALSVEWMAPHEALDAVLRSRGLDFGSPAATGAREAAYLIDMEVRTTRRLAFVEAVGRTGLPVTICGLGWESELGRFSNATYEGAVDMARMAELMSRSRVVLNTNGNFGAGSHERPFSASLAGAAIFSDYSSYYAEVFEPGRSIELFRWKALDDGMAALAALAGDPGRCLDYARIAKRETLARHTWDHRIALIFAAAGLSGAPSPQGGRGPRN